MLHFIFPNFWCLPNEFQNMKYVNYRNNNFRCEVEYSTPFVSPVMRKDANVVRNHEYSDIDTLPLASSVQFQLHHPDVLNGNKVRSTV